MNLVYFQVFRDFERFPVFKFGILVENLLVCGVLSSSHSSTPHTIGSKRLNLGFLFCSYVCGLSHFEDLIRFLKSFSVYPALLEAFCPFYDSREGTIFGKNGEITFQHIAGRIRTYFFKSRLSPQCQGCCDWCLFNSVVAHTKLYFRGECPVSSGGEIHLDWQ